jgi:uncharacterized protein YoxC
MAVSKKVITDLQKQILVIRRQTEERLAEKAAVQEEINKLTFTLSLYQAERMMDEATLAKIEELKNRISDLEDRIRLIPSRIRELEAKQRKLRISGLARG